MDTNWAQQNPSFEVILWLDKQGAKNNSIYGENFLTATRKIQDSVNAFGLSNIKIKDFIEVLGIELFVILCMCIRYEIDRLNPNYGAASDLIRLGVLYIEGGAYYDSDVAPQDLLGSNKTAFIWSDEEKTKVFMSQRSANDIIVCAPYNEVIQKMLNTAIRHYHLRDCDRYLGTYLSENPFYVVSNTINKTGPDLIHSAGVFESITENPNLRTVKNPEAEQEWCFRGIKKLESGKHNKKLLNDLMEQIKFEINTSNILRLESYLETFLLAVMVSTEGEKETLIDEFLCEIDKIFEVYWNNIELIQYSFKYEIFNPLCKKYDLLSKSGLPLLDYRITSTRIANPLFNIRYIDDVLKSIIDVVCCDFTNMAAFAQAMKFCIPTEEDAELSGQVGWLQSAMLNSTTMPNVYKILDYFYAYNRKYGRDCNLENAIKKLQYILESKNRFIEYYILKLKEQYTAQLEQESVYQQLEELKELYKGMIFSFNDLTQLAEMIERFDTRERKLIREWRKCLYKHLNAQILLEQISEDEDEQDELSVSKNLIVKSAAASVAFIEQEEGKLTGDDKDDKTQHSPPTQSKHNKQ